MKLTKKELIFSITPLVIIVALVGLGIIIGRYTVKRVYLKENDNYAADIFEINLSNNCLKCQNNGVSFIAALVVILVTFFIVAALIMLSILSLTLIFVFKWLASEVISILFKNEHPETWQV